MKKIEILGRFFVFAVVAMTVGAFVSNMDISSEYKTVTAYVVACVVAYVFYVISGEAKRDDIEDGEDE